MVQQFIDQIQYLPRWLSQVNLIQLPLHFERIINMIIKNSDFENSVHRLKSSFKQFQSLLNQLKSSPLTLLPDIPIINIWLHDQGIQSLINAFCVPILCDGEPKIKTEDLEEYKLDLDLCKIQFNKDDHENFKNQESKNKIHSDNNLNQLIQSHSASSYSQNDQNSHLKKDYKRGPYKNYTVQQKMEAVRMLLEENCSVIQISRKLHIPCKNIKRWSQQGVERKKGGGRKRFSPETEKAVANYLKSNFEKGAEVGYEQVQKIALDLSDDQSFKASRGWVVKFVDRQELRNYYKFV